MLEVCFLFKDRSRDARADLWLVASFLGHAFGGAVGANAVGASAVTPHMDSSATTSCRTQEQNIWKKITAYIMRISGHAVDGYVVMTIMATLYITVSSDAYRAMLFQSPFYKCP